MTTSTPSTQPTADPPLLRMAPSRAVWAVAWPMIAIGLLKTTYFLTDSWFVGRIGDEALEALGGAAFAWWMIFICSDLAGTGAHALIARHEGSQRRDLIPATLVQGLWVGLGVTVFLAACWPQRQLYFELLGFHAGTETMRLGLDFLGVSLLTAGTLVVHTVTGAAFRALGHTRTALVITAATLVVNAALDPLLIWGLGPIPALGIAGAAWATAAANLVGAALGLAVLTHRRIRLVPALPDATKTWLITKIGTPVTVAGIGFSMVYVLLGRIITEYGAHHIAALGVGHRLESLAYMVTVGLSVGAATMVGQHLGAGNIERAREAVAAANRICVGFMLPIGVLLFAGAEVFFDWFTDDPDIIASGSVYMRCQTLVFVAMGVEVVYEGAFSGAGDTLPPLIIGGSLTAARIPLAIWFGSTLGLGILGVWIAIAVSTALKAVVSWFWWRRGRWATALSNAEAAA